MTENEYWKDLEVKVDGEYLQKVEDFAARHNIADDLMRNLDILRSFKHGDKKVVLTRDFAPYSFIFDAGWVYGGLIYHGPGDVGVGAPTFSVRLGSSAEGWSIHT